MTKREQRALAVILAALMLCLTALPASAATATATTMRLSKYTGAVDVASSSGRTLSKRTNMLLYNGYSVETGKKSYAWINLDNTKLAKLDAVSKVEVRKSGKKLDVLLKSGNIFFNVSKPLEDDEVLNVRTSTMIMGIRGTSGIIRVVDRWATEIYVLDGTVQCSAADPVTGQVKTETLQAGDRAVAVAYPQDREGDKCDIILERLGTDDIGGFVLEELAQDPGLCDEIYEQTGLDVRDITEEAARERLEQDEQEMQDELDRIENEAAGQENNVSSDLIWEEEQPGTEPEPAPSAPSRPSLGGGAAPAPAPAAYTLTVNYVYEDGVTEAAPAYTQQLTAGSSYSVPSPEIAGCTVDIPVVEGTMPAGDQTVTVTYTAGFRMPKTAAEVQQYLTDHGPGTYTLLPSLSGNAADNTLTVELDDTMIISEGYTLDLSGGIDVTVASGGSLTVNGTLAGTGALTNESTVTVYSPNTLKMGAIENIGDFTVFGTGRVVVTNGLTTSNQLTVAGAIEGSVTVSGGTVTATNGSISGGSGTAVTVNNGIFEAAFSTFDGTVTVNGGTFVTYSSTIDGSVAVHGGMAHASYGSIIDGGSGPAVTVDGGELFVDGGEAVSSGGATILCGTGGRLYLYSGTVTNSGSGYAVSAVSDDNVVFETSNVAFQAKHTSLFFAVGNAPLMPPGYTAVFNPVDGRYRMTATSSVYACATSGEVEWSLTNDGMMTVFGTGTMGDFPAWSVYSTQIKTAVIDEGVTTIGGYAFASCGNLTDVTIPNSVTSIGFSAFIGCESLTSVTIPNSVTSIGEYAFTDCTSLTNVAIPNNVTSIEGYTFMNCYGLESVTIGSSVASIGDLAFASCGSLESVAIPNGVEIIGANSFSECTGLKSIFVPVSVISLGWYAFSGCTGLTDIYFGGDQAQWTTLNVNTGITTANVQMYYNSTGLGNPGTRALMAARAVPAAAGPFTDVPNDAWYGEAVQYVYENGLMKGDGGGKFSPGSPTSRGMLVTILHRMEEEPAASGAAFPDVPDGKWYTDAVAWAGANGIVTGYDNGSFGPEDPLTREQMAAILYRYAVYKGYDTEVPGDVSAFPNGDRVSAYAADAMNWAVGAGLLQGSDGLLLPGGGAIRAQTATILMRFCRKVAGIRTMTLVSAMDIMCEPSGILFLEDGSFLVTDTYNKVIWRVEGDSRTVYLGPSSVYAGSDTVTDPFDRPIGGYNDAALRDSYFRLPWAIVPFLNGYAVSDADNNVVRLIRFETIQTVNGVAAESPSTTHLSMAFEHPTGLASDEAGNLYVSDTFAGAVRKITPGGKVTTFVKDLDDPMGLCWKDGTLYIAETGANRIVKTTGDRLTVVAGSGEDDLVDGPAAQAAFSSPQGVAVGDDGTVYVSDTVNGAVRQIRDGKVTTLAIRDESDLDSYIPASPVGLAVFGDKLYVCDSFARKVFVISPI